MKWQILTYASFAVAFAALWAVCATLILGGSANWHFILALLGMACGRLIWKFELEYREFARRMRRKHRPQPAPDAGEKEGARRWQEDYDPSEFPVSLQEVLSLTEMQCPAPDAGEEEEGR